MGRPGPHTTADDEDGWEPLGDLKKKSVPISRKNSGASNGVTRADQRRAAVAMTPTVVPATEVKPKGAAVVYDEPFVPENGTETGGVFASLKASFDGTLRESAATVAFNSTASALTTDAEIENAQRLDGLENHSPAEVVNSLLTSIAGGAQSDARVQAFEQQVRRLQFDGLLDPAKLEAFSLGALNVRERREKYQAELTSWLLDNGHANELAKVTHERALAKAKFKSWQASYTAQYKRDIADALAVTRTDKINLELDKARLAIDEGRADVVDGKFRVAIRRIEASTHDLQLKTQKILQERAARRELWNARLGSTRVRLAIALGLVNAPFIVSNVIVQEESQKNMRVVAGVAAFPGWLWSHSVGYVANGAGAMKTNAKNDLCEEVRFCDSDAEYLEPQPQDDVTPEAPSGFRPGDYVELRIPGQVIAAGTASDLGLA